MSSIRQQKFEALMQQEFGKFFREEARGVCLGAMVTATGVRVAPDLSFARVYLSIFGTPDIQAVYKNILTQKNQIRFEMGKRLGKSLRRIPEFGFEIDDSLDYSEKIDKLLKGK
ncbi:MAG: 30S ribosome-binding factor RbfA [Crocinitomicaceae bacterium]|jgi:ribosome-binding factor A|nr:30S ribosome-binding factor RbfA [Crocinitomicaceae bacterium]MBK6951199.1 30S ribosome-binding factor RbfA [Crocinitomicaceae bacterium]MBK9590596.1 30S ribosome-binding factor RbfA [Crocinitomicaceae bacterium]